MKNLYTIVFFVFITTTLVAQNNPSPFIGTNLTRGENLRVLRLAVSTTGEYTTDVGGLANVNANLQTWLAQINELYGREYSVRFELVANNNSLIYTDAGTDPWPDMSGQSGCNGSSNILNIQGSVIDGVIGAANYDISHVILGSNFNGGGCAGSFNTGYSGGLDIPVTRHEIGHQFSQSHTITNGGNNNYEPGNGGWSIMGGNSHPYAHSNSFHQLANHLLTTEKNAGTKVPTLNTIPTVDAGPDISIPKNTPYLLKAIGNDPDPGNSLTYAWDFLDAGIQQSIPVADDSQGPLFMRLMPNNNSTRSIPQTSDVIASITAGAQEQLPTQARDMNIRVTVNDGNTFDYNTVIVPASGVNSDDVKITVVNTVNPFFVGTQNTDVVYSTGTTQLVGWNVVGTNVAPINCTIVDIKLSVDGGWTYPYTLASGTANDGSENVTIPLNIPQATSLARIKVECASFDNVRFFDVGNSNFTINSDCKSFAGIIYPTDPVSAPTGDNALDLSPGIIYEPRTTSTIPFSIENSDPSSVFGIYENSNNLACISGCCSVPYEEVAFTVDQTGTYTINFSYNGSSEMACIYNGSYNAASPCTNFMTSGAYATMGGVGYNSNQQVNFIAGQTYILTVHKLFTAGTATGSMSISSSTGGNAVILTGGSAPPVADYSYTYAAVNSETGVIAAVNANADFKSLAGGTYHVYGMSYKSANTPPAIVDPNSVISQTKDQAQNSGKCINFSLNHVVVKVEVCKMITVLPTETSACDPGTGTYTQKVKIIYETPPGSGTISVNGQNFAITSSPQFETLTGLLADGQPVNITASFTANPGCQFSAANSFTGPVSDKVAGTALNFDGNTNEYVSLDGISFTSSSFTLMAWVKPNGIQNDYTGIIFSDDPTDATGLNFFTNNELGFHWKSTEWFWQSGLFVPADVWSHVALVINNTTATLYLNGVPSVNSNISGTSAFSAVQFGTYKAWASRNFNGLMDEARIYNVALTTQQVREKMHIVADVCDADLLAYYQFNETSGLKDQTRKTTTILTGALTKSDSEAPVADGTAVTKTVNATGTFNFNSPSDANLSINFLNATPNGDVVVSYLTTEGPHGTAASVDPLSPDYWIVRNFGSTNTGLNASMTFRQPTWATSSNASEYSIHKRGSNSTGAWDPPVLANNANGTSGEVLFTGIDGFSQFIMSGNISAGPCHDVVLSCGQVYNGDTSTGTNNHSVYSNCVDWDESGKEIIHRIETNATGNITASLSNVVGGDLDVFILSSCEVTLCLANGDVTAVANNQPVGTYYIIVDGYQGASGTYSLSVTANCNNQSCNSPPPANGAITSGVYQDTGDISTSGTISSPSDVTFKAGGNIELDPDFEVQQGASFEALIEACNALVRDLSKK